MGRVFFWVPLVGCFEPTSAEANKRLMPFVCTTASTTRPSRQGRVVAPEIGLSLQDWRGGTGHPLFCAPLERFSSSRLSLRL